HLDGDDLSQAMHRPVDAGHATTANALDDRVGAKEEALGVSAADDAGLILGDGTVVGQPARERRHVAAGPLALPALVEFAHLFRRQKTVAGERVAEPFNGLLLRGLNAFGHL